MRNIGVRLSSSGVPPGTISDKPGLDAVNLFRAMEDGRVQAALLMCTNPAQSLPAADRYRAGMEKCFLAVAEIFEDSETARFADVCFRRRCGSKRKVHRAGRAALSADGKVARSAGAGAQRFANAG